ncbi:hypothetical protein BH753_gp155 [Bacillus phage Shbh1]|uniref:Uncharacterized protein n=1 Tax=Bacillus phage Shbh1 TaxID=1796992 RepID=A0A142F1I0_9CAUD|nr:hypothetical protein BH753_gp155 [Bacillus phage Shbh1]AMQ66637.1 hypothetical protein [Bacillus phage Shbh1]
MKTELEVINGSVVITTVDGNFNISIDLTTAEVTALNYLDASVHELASFLNKARTRYNKFMSSTEVENYITK